jgi:hypothetical protein
MSIRRVPLTVAFILASAAIASGCTPAKAPGSNPEDMTPEGHKAAAEQEKEKAAEHEQMKEEVGPSKPMTEETEKSQHEQQAETHKDYAEQHEKAGEAAAPPKK